jgi:GTPase SAR1 family protein
MDLRLRMGSSMMVVGPTSSGKTVFIMKLIDHAEELFDIKPTKVFWCYGTKTAIHDSMVMKNYNMIQGIPTDFDFVTPNSIVMLDDLMVESANDKNVSKMFIRGAHHVPCFVIYTQQNLFVRGSENRNRQLNTQYLVLFKNRMDKLQIRYLEQRLFPSSKTYLVESYKHATREPHSYIMIDSVQDTAELVQLRSRILPTERPMVTYVDKRTYGPHITSNFLQ